MDPMLRVQQKMGMVFHGFNPFAYLRGRETRPAFRSRTKGKDPQFRKEGARL